MQRSTLQLFWIIDAISKVVVQPSLRSVLSGMMSCVRAFAGKRRRRQRLRTAYPSQRDKRTPCRSRMAVDRAARVLTVAVFSPNGGIVRVLSDVFYQIFGG